MNVKILTGISILGLGLVGLSGSANAADPIDPQTGSTPVDVNFASGLLTLDAVPNPFNFGTLAISDEVVTANLVSTNTYSAGITDLRGSEAGYVLTVQAEPLTAFNGAKLDGSNITLDDGTAIFVGTEQGSATAPVVNQAITADTLDLNGDPVPTAVATAANNTTEGLQSWSIAWTGNNINLIVNPTEAQAVSYQTNLVWTLSDVPVL